MTTAARILHELAAVVARRHAALSGGVSGVPLPRLLYSGGDDGNLSDSETETTLIFAFVVSMLSLVGSLFIIVFQVRVRN